MIAIRGMASAVLIGCLVSLVGGQAQAQTDNTKYTKTLKIEVPATESQLAALAKLAATVVRSKVKGATLSSVPLWDIYTGFANLVSAAVGGIIKHGELCREAAAALVPDITGTTNRQKWTDVEITYVPPVGSTSTPITTTAKVFFTAAYTGGSIRIHFEDLKGNVLPGMGEECVNSNIPPYGG